jgi:DNA ligase-1
MKAADAEKAARAAEPKPKKERDKDIVMTAKTYSDGDPSGWWLSEKLDGMRMFWDGSKALSRKGKPVYIPDFFRDQLPTGMALDGELWLGRGRFQETMSIVKRHTPDERWRNIQYRVYSAPGIRGGFEAEMAAVAAITGRDVNAQGWSGRRGQLCLHQQVRCENFTHMKDVFKGFVKTGAEGIMLRRAGSDWEIRRSPNLLKYKPWLKGVDALVTGHQAGEGKHRGRLGALLCVFVPGQAELEKAAAELKIPVNYIKPFGVGTGFTDWDRENPPAVGSRIKMNCQGLTDAGLPRFPVFEAEVTD